MPPESLRIRVETVGSSPRVGDLYFRRSEERGDELKTVKRVVKKSHP